MDEFVISFLDYVDYELDNNEEEGVNVGTETDIIGNINNLLAKEDSEIFKINYKMKKIDSIFKMAIDNSACDLFLFMANRGSCISEKIEVEYLAYTHINILINEILMKMKKDQILKHRDQHKNNFKQGKVRDLYSKDSKIFIKKEVVVNTIIKYAKYEGYSESFLSKLEDFLEINEMIRFIPKCALPIFTYSIFNVIVDLEKNKRASLGTDEDFYSEKYLRMKYIGRREYPPVYNSGDNAQKFIDADTSFLISTSRLRHFVNFVLYFKYNADLDFANDIDIAFNLFWFNDLNSCIDVINLAENSLKNYWSNRDNSLDKIVEERGILTSQNCFSNYHMIINYRELSYIDPKTVFETYDQFNLNFSECISNTIARIPNWNKKIMKYRFRHLSIIEKYTNDFVNHFGNPIFKIDNFDTKDKYDAFFYSHKYIYDQKYRKEYVVQKK